MGSSKTYLRLLSFAGVLILSGALMLGLFQGAQAADMNWVESDTSPSGTTDYTFEIVIPNGQSVPIENVGAAVEADNPDFDGKRGALTTAHAQCPMDPLGGMDCTPDGEDPDLLSVDGQSGVITRLQLDRIYEQGENRDMDSGYSVECDQEACYFETSGYGYDGSLSHLDDQDDGYSSQEWRDTGVGYGYGYEMGRAEAEVTDQAYTGYGYHQSGEGDLVIEFTVTLDADQLDSGTTYWVSGVVDTGTDIVGAFTTNDLQFSPSTGGGGPPVNGGGGGGADDTFDLGTSFDVEVGDTITITDLPDGFTGLELTFDQACDDCTIEMETHGTSAPSGTDALATSWQAIEYFSLWVEDADGNEVEGYIDEGTIEFEVDSDDLDDEEPGQVALTHNMDGGWAAEETTHTNDAGDDPLEYEATISGFSVFAQATDTEGPQVSNMEPTGEITQTSPTITADWEDNRGVDTDSLELMLDGETADDSTGTLIVREGEFTYVPGTGLDIGEHDVEIEVSDESGLTTTETWTFTVQEPACPELPTLTDPQPADGATDVQFEDGVSIAVAEGSCPLDALELVVAGETVATSLDDDGRLTGEIPSSVEAGQQVNATATASDDEGNDQAREWSFTMAEDAEPPADGGGALVWVIVGLVVLAIIGVGAYFYNQQ